MLPKNINNYIYFLANNLYFHMLNKMILTTLQHIFIFLFWCVLIVSYFCHRSFVFCHQFSAFFSTFIFVFVSSSQWVCSCSSWSSSSWCSVCSFVAGISQMLQTVLGHNLSTSQLTRLLAMFSAVLDQEEARAWRPAEAEAGFAVSLSRRWLITPRTSEKLSPWKQRLSKILRGLSNPSPNWLSLNSKAWPYRLQVLECNCLLVCQKGLHPTKNLCSNKLSIFWGLFLCI